MKFNGLEEKLQEIVVDIVKSRYTHTNSPLAPEYGTQDEQREEDEAELVIHESGTEVPQTSKTAPKESERKESMDKILDASNVLGILRSMNMDEKMLEEIVRKSVMEVLKAYDNLPPGVTPADIDRRFGGDEDTHTTLYYPNQAVGQEYGAILEAKVPHGEVEEATGRKVDRYYTSPEAAAESRMTDPAFEDWRMEQNEKQAAMAMKSEDEEEDAQKAETLKSLAHDYISVRGFGETEIIKRAKIVEKAVKELNVSADEFRIYANKQ